MMLFLADAGDLIGGLVTILIILVTVGSAIRQALQQKKTGEKGSGAGRLSQKRGGGRGTPSDDIQKFLAELTKQTSGGGKTRPPAQQTPQQQREQQPAQRVPRARPVPAGYGQQKAAPAQPRREQAQQRRQPQEVTVRRSQQRTPRKLTAEQVRAHRERRLRKEAAEAVASRKAAEAQQRKGRERKITSVEKAAEEIRTSTANRLETLLPDDPLQRAIVLRDVLGSCRARDRYRPGRW